MSAVLRSSEFWMALIATIGQAGASAGWWTLGEFDQYLKGALAYAAGRLTSKFVKRISFNPNGGQK